MFGNSGFEIVRAIQHAVAYGADVSIILDRQQAAGEYSWINSARANLFDENMMSFFNKKGLDFAATFNNEFDNHMLKKNRQLFASAVQNIKYKNPINQLNNKKVPSK